MSVFLSPNLPANVVEIGNEISQAKINEINAGTLATQTWVTTGFAPKASPTFTGTVTIPAGASIAGYLTDAPSNGSQYARQNGAWAVVTGGGGGGVQFPNYDNSVTYTVGSQVIYSYRFFQMTTAIGAAGYDPIGNPSYWTEISPTLGTTWGSITGTVTSQTDLTSYVTGLGYVAGTAASQLTNATYVTNPVAAPTTAGDVLQFNGTTLIWAAGGGGGGAWGSITGTLSSQTDLQSALDAKLSPRTVNTVSTSYTIQLSDANKVIHLASGGMGFSTTLELDANIAYVDGTVIFVTVDNTAFAYSINAPFGGGVSINAGSTYNITSGVTTLVKVTANTWCAG
jgi:hypothetical protein